MISTDGLPHMETYISAGNKYRNRLSIVVSGDSGSMVSIQPFKNKMQMHIRSILTAIVEIILDVSI